MRVNTSGAPSNVLLFAFRDPAPNGKLVIVAANADTNDTVMHAVLNGADATSFVPWQTSSALDLEMLAPISVSGGAFDAALPAQSVTTFVGDSL